MVEIKIEHNIEIPQPRKQGEAKKYPWREMKVGDSFLVPRLNDEHARMTRERASNIIQYAKRTGHQYCSRTVNGGIRIWRIA